MEKFSSLFSIKLIGPQIKLVTFFYYNKIIRMILKIYGCRCMNQIICSSVDYVSEFSFNHNKKIIMI